MERRIGAFEARRQFSKLLNDVERGRDSYVVERHGEAVAAVVPIQVYDQWKRSREAFFDRMEETARRAGMSEEEGMALAQEAVEHVRAARRQRTA
ncbi:MAG TPA: type II toxin-antitoxin system Phd/YefM family antitoxin [Dehalococcoidia bacterium]|jgi:prevent-host-death family protein|nr:type II toxin-antitoxin system Phd/YefM family antitoxin [Dehalococcoidia bacterium]